MNIKNQILCGLICLWKCFEMGWANPTGQLNLKQLLTDADRARGAVSQGMTWEVELESTEDDETTSTTYFVQALGDDAHVEVLAPARHKEEVLLFNDRNIWFFKPGLKKPLAISARQKLSGQAANGDIASTQYARDYDATLLTEEAIDGEPCYVLMLVSKAKNTTYDKIKYWISKKRRLGIKSEFLTLEGKAMKVAFLKYDFNILISGEKTSFVSEVKIVDGKNPKNQSIMRYAKPKSAVLYPKLFNSNNLMR